MAGILDPMMDPRTQGLLAAGFQGLQASGPSRMPVSLGQVIGQGGMAGLNTMNNAAVQQGRLKLAEEQISAMKEQREAQAQLLQEQLAEKQRRAKIIGDMTAELNSAQGEDKDLLNARAVKYIMQLDPIAGQRMMMDYDAKLEAIEQRREAARQRSEDNALSREERAAALRERFAHEERIKRLVATLRPSEPLVPIADSNSPTGFSYATRGNAVGAAAPAPAGSPERKAAGPLTSSDLSKWVDREGNHPPAGTSMADLQRPDSPYRVLSAAQTAMNAKFKGAQAALDKMTEFIDQIWDPNDTESNLQARTKYLVKFKKDRLTQGDNGIVSQFDSFSKGTIPTLVRAAGEVGNLNEFEQQRALQMIPKEGDTAPVARAKMANLEDWLYNASRGAVGMPNFKSEEEVKAAAKAGKIKSGDRVRVNGKRATWKED